MRRKR